MPKHTNIVSDYTAAGYRAPMSAQELSAETQRIDATMCALARCKNCQIWGMQYIPLVKIENGIRASYVAVARCPECGNEVEF